MKQNQGNNFRSIKLNFGKHEDWPLKSVPSDYLDWMIKEKITRFPSSRAAAGRTWSVLAALELSWRGKSRRGATPHTVIVDSIPVEDGDPTVTEALNQVLDAKDFKLAPLEVEDMDTFLEATYPDYNVRLNRSLTFSAWLDSFATEAWHYGTERIEGLGETIVEYAGLKFTFANVESQPEYLYEILSIAKL